MLVLTRKLNESIQIGDDIEVKVLGIDGDQIKLGIDAPKSIEIHRQEIYIDIQEQNNAAANLSASVLKLLNNQEDKN